MFLVGLFQLMVEGAVSLGWLAALFLVEEPLLLVLLLLFLVGVWRLFEVS
tara:strand:- start:309 stop:458 length:150 start_codon:yes stop_codon:yes gene_type:complete